VVGDAGELPFEDGSLDVVLSPFTVFVMRDPEAALCKWARLLAGAAGLTPAVLQQRTIEFAVDDEPAWWDWNWSHASRPFLKALWSASARAFQGMQNLREPNGSPRTSTAIFAAARPGL
jgi:ubiquinone/menaquinone biosynthesis C-methylase UbiE